MQLYLTLPIGDSGAYVKGGYMQITMTTNETLATGSEYGDGDMDGTVFGLGYHNEFGNGMFIRFEGQYMDLGSLSLTSKS